ncbi:MAG: hypothetical protein IKK33_06305 [Lachnospiraceae bacterium]|nr:hypothetical protein [Lachnospiraceae bacterium]
MATITYDSIRVNGIKFNKILALEINHCIDEHSTARIKGEVEASIAKEEAARLTDQLFVSIITTAEEQPQYMFCGVVLNAQLGYEDVYCIMEVTLISTSYLLDIARNSRTFQKTGMSYGEMFEQMFGDKAEVEMNVSDTKIGGIVMQYNETDWEFVRRMASRFQAGICPDVRARIPRIIVGVPSAQRQISVLNRTGSTILKSRMNTNDKGSCMVYTGTSYDYAFLGDMFGNEGYIVAVRAELVDGILKCYYQYGSHKVFSVPLTLQNTQVSGRMFRGEVKEVKADKVRVYLLDVDEQFASDSDYWFPYSTAYSSDDGSGFYCMPKEGDIVRIFFPSEKETDAFAASSVNVSPQENPLYKSWRNENKEILLTPDGIVISCETGKIIISLKEENGITISSDQNINITSPRTIKISSDTTVEIEGQHEILLHTGSSYIDILPDKISFGGEEMLIN